ncbi:hypothetical protein DTL42_02030 [Bremerella cremea]|uniref:Uncharacterized protein n=1 Tax=Bremerella cremea TaxID=1031537 RepID=A0A368KWY6_9BACT|nr:hypothetical protein DTL42_02030 [Bremerella cremea]
MRGNTPRTPLFLKTAFDAMIDSLSQLLFNPFKSGLHYGAILGIAIDFVKIPASSYLAIY